MGRLSGVPLLEVGFLNCGAGFRFFGQLDHLSLPDLSRLQYGLNQGVPSLLVQDGEKVLLFRLGHRVGKIGLVPVLDVFL